MVRTLNEGSYSPWRTQHFDMPMKAEMGVRPLPIAAGDLSLGREVALKMLHARVTHDLQSVARFPTVVSCAGWKWV